MILRKKRNEEEEWYAAVWNERRVDVENMIRREEILRRETKEETKQSEKEELPEDVELSKKEDIPENPESSGEKVPADTEAPEEEELTENVEQSEPVEKLEDDRESLTEEVTEKEDFQCLSVRHRKSLSVNLDHCRIIRFFCPHKSYISDSFPILIFIQIPDKFLHSKSALLQKTYLL